MSYFNQKVYKKSYLLEFRLNGSVTDSVAFSVPPQSEEFTFPQRIGETKTFGGSVFEDYGNDAIKITITGNTVNSSVRIIYKGSQGISYMTGEEEIFYVKKLIQQYGEIDNLKKKKVYLYSLSDSKNKWWRVLINDFQIKRSKENPMIYSYTLQCTSVPNLTDTTALSSKLSKLKWVSNLTEQINKWCENINSFSSTLYDGLSAFREGLDLITTLDNCVTQLKTSVENLYAIISGYSSTVSDYVQETLSLGDNVINTALRLSLGEGNDLFSKVNDLLESVSDLKNYVINFDDNQIATSLISQYGTTASEIKNTWLKLVNKIESNADSVDAESKKSQNEISYTVIPGEEGVDDEVVIVYGYTEKKVADGDSWDAIAKEYYGDASLGSLIAIYNGVSSTDSLNVGSSVYIPNIVPTNSSNQENQIYNESGVKDNYGQDASVNDNGSFDTSQNDLVIKKGTDNLAQAINSRLRSSIDNRIRLNVYGIRNQIGSTQALQSYLTSSIQETLSEEPRIKSVDNIEYSGMGDNINIVIHYTDINNQSQTFGGTY